MVTVIGLGQMGLAMAGRLMATGGEVSGWDLDAGRRAAAVALGLAVTETAAGPVVILSLPNAAVVGRVLPGLLARMASGGVVIDCSTLEPDAARGFAAAAAALGIAYLDAPVSGGPAGAAAGALTVMIGGTEAGLAAAQPILACIAARVVHVGESGAGQVAKLVNNLLVATHRVVAGEALRLGAAAGVAVERLLPVINAASGRSAATEVNWPRWIASGSFDSGFSAGLMRKDVRLALGLAESLGVPLHATAEAGLAWERSAVPDAADFNRVASAVFEGEGA